MPWRKGAATIDIHLNRGTQIDDDDNDDNHGVVEEDEEEQEGEEEDEYEAAIRPKPKSVAAMTVPELREQLQLRAANTAGFAADLRPRLVRLLDAERERSWTHDGDLAGVVNVQVDNAPPHCGGNNIEKLRAAGLRKGFKIRTILQPPRSPDLNKCDMSVFAMLSSQSNSYKVKSATLEDLIVNVAHAFEDFPVNALERTYAQCFEVYRCILANNGGIDYPTPHSGINNRQRRGEPLVDYYVDVALVESARAWLEANPIQ